MRIFFETGEFFTTPMLLIRLYIRFSKFKLIAMSLLMFVFADSYEFSPYPCTEIVFLLIVASNGWKTISSVTTIESSGTS